jgi:5-methylcytosine-specific restriction protein A
MKRGHSKLDVKRPPVTPEERNARKLVKRRDGYWCVGCGIEPATDFHHLQSQGTSGPGWRASNGVRLCRPCHRFVTDHPAWSYRRGLMVKSTDDTLLKAVWFVALHGWYFLDDMGGKRFAPGLPDPVDPCPLGCAVWTSNDNCDCEERS